MNNKILCLVLMEINPRQRWLLFLLVIKEYIVLPNVNVSISVIVVLILLLFFFLSRKKRHCECS